MPSLLVLLQQGGRDIPVFRGSLAFLRVLRILRFQRYVKDEDSFTNLEIALGIIPEGSVKPARPTDLPLARVTATLFSLLVVTAGFLYEAEPQIPDFPTAIYYGLTTMTTIGTIEPKTPQGTFIVSISILIGIGVLPLQLSALAEAFTGAQSARAKSVPAHIDLYGEEGGGGLDSALTAGLAGADITCQACGAKGHRKDAQFCFACGAKMAPEDLLR